jgi:tetratricopeptide (TPR) repeat protein
MNRSDYTQPQARGKGQRRAQAVRVSGLYAAIRNTTRGVILAPVGVLILAGFLAVALFAAAAPSRVQAGPAAVVPLHEGPATIVVADFDDRSAGRYHGADPAQAIYDKLVEQIRADGLPVHVERLHQVVNDTSARSAGQTASATLVLWGWYDALAITPRLERTATLAASRSMEVGQHLSMVDPGRVELGAVTDLPGQAAYVALFALGLEQYSQQDFGRGLDYLERALTAAPSQAYFFQGNIHVLSAAEYEAALADYTHALELNPADDRAYTNRGNTYYALAQYDAALADYNRALELKPGIAETYYARAVAQRALHAYQAALSDFTHALELEAGYAQAYNGRGDTYYDMGQYRTALADYNHAIALDSQDAEIFNSRGVTYARLGELEAALPDFTSAVHLDPRNDKAYYNRGTLYYTIGNYTAALADFDRVLELIPNDAETHNNRGNAYYAVGRYDAAVADYTRALEMNPGLVQAYNNRGAAYEAEGRINRAIADFERFLSLTDNPVWRAAAEQHLRELKGIQACNEIAPSCLSA